MIKIGIDINNNLRNFNYKFAEKYIHEFGDAYKIHRKCRRRGKGWHYPDDDFSRVYACGKKHAKRFYNNIDPQHCKKYFPFKSNKEYYEFVDVDYAQELSAFAPLMHKSINGQLINWMNEYLDEKTNGEVEIILVSPGEMDIAALGTMFFIAKGAKVRHVLIHGKKRIWEECDVVITANPKLMKACPQGKQVVKIDRDYNRKCKCSAHYRNLHELFLDSKFLEKLNIETNE